VLKPGDGANFPHEGDKLTMHYTGTLAFGGNKFDSSRDKGQPFSFVIGKGQVITGWDQGIVTMSLGERAILHVPSYKGYGSNGAPPDIPPDAALDFDVELLAINDKKAPQFAEAESKACTWTWTEHPGKYSGGYAGGVSTKFDLNGAKEKCTELGTTTCAAVTCGSDGICTVRGSPSLHLSPSGEITYVPSNKCDGEAAFATQGLNAMGAQRVNATSARRVNVTNATFIRADGGFHKSATPTAHSAGPLLLLVAVALTAHGSVSA
jgi:hypothetical protein